MTGKRRIASHSDLVGSAPLLNKILSKSPRLGMLLMVDPVRALRQAGFELEPAMAQHLKSRLAELGMGSSDRRLYGRIERGEVEIPWIDGVALDLTNPPKGRRTNSKGSR